MSLQFSVPIFIALVALFIADEQGQLLSHTYRSILSLGKRPSVIGRLTQLGKVEDSDYENFRISQMALAGSLFTLITIGLFLNVISFTFYFLLTVIDFLLMPALLNRRLTLRVTRRQREVESEFPAIVEMLTLAVGAGESPAAAIKRITQRAEGHISEEFKRVVKEVESGTAFTVALDSMNRRINSETLRRFVDSIIISISRGTPLVETLTHGVSESRNQERVRLLTAAGKSEISMMIPVVFLILPISILFALYPSLTNLNLFSS